MSHTLWPRKNLTRDRYRTRSAAPMNNCATANARMTEIIPMTNSNRLNLYLILSVVRNREAK